MWFWRCQTAREEGARVVADQGSVARPCDPDDVYRVALAQYRAGALGLAHLRVMARFGRGLCPPDPREPREEKAARLWEEGLESLGVALAKKGIVERESPGRAA